MDSISIKKLTSEFVSSVCELEQDLIGTSSFESVSKTLDSNTLFYYVLLEEKKLIGFFECSIIAPEAELYDIAIKRDMQGKGYSKLLMDYFLNLVKEKGCDTVLLEVNKINNKAINLYDKYGFKKYGERKNYYGENDAVLMRLEL